MHVVNIHQRRLARPASEVGRMIDTLASDRDVLWPRSMWPAMRFDRPLAIGAIGGHGPIRYSVDEYIPGQRVRFKFSAPRGFNGHHEFETLPDGDATLLRHTLEMSTVGPALITWPLIFRPLHNALIEDALATGQVSLGLAPTIEPWSYRVRFLRWLLSGGRTRPQRIDN